MSTEKSAEKLTEKKKALDTAMSKIDKQYGKGTVMLLGQTSTLNVEAISTGSIGLDIALGIGGLPRGRIVEMFGPESSGKTTLALHCIAEAQKQGGIAAFIDVEHALDPIYADALGVDIDNLLVSQPDNGEQALEITEELVRSGAIDVIVIDSVAALVPKAEVEGDMGSAFVGMQARLMSQALRKLTSAIGKSNCVAIFINQLREKVGIVYGSPEVTPGGRALKFYSSVRIDIRKAEAIKSGSDVIGSRTKAKVVKNKIAPPFRTAEFDIMYGEGISHTGELLDMAVELGIIRKGGAWFSYGDAKIGQGRENAKIFLADHPDVADEIEAKVRENAAKVIIRRRARDKADEAASQVEEDAGELPEEGEPDVFSDPDTIVIDGEIITEDGEVLKPDGGELLKGDGGEVLPIPQDLAPKPKKGRGKKNVDITVD